MSMTKTFALSPQACAELAQLASFNRMTEDAVLEAIVQEFSPSTDAERAQQQRDRTAARNQARISISDPCYPAWRKGYAAGWMGFQLRKASSLYRKFQVHDEPETA